MSRPYRSETGMAAQRAHFVVRAGIWQGLARKREVVAFCIGSPYNNSSHAGARADGFLPFFLFAWLALQRALNRSSFERLS